MKAEIKKRWIDALKSGEYKQGRGRLKDGGSYCCLGVLCDLFFRETEDTDWGSEGMLLSTWFLPVRVKIWSGLESIAPETSKGSLIWLNDDSKWSCNEIVGIIDDQL